MSDDSKSSALGPTTVAAESAWVFSFGRNDNGECGRPPPAAASASAAAAPDAEKTEKDLDPVKAALLADPRCVTTLSNLQNGIVSVGCGLYHSMAVSSSGELYTWGAGSGGQLGRTRAGGGGSTKAVGMCATPTVVAGLQSRQQHVLRAVGGRNHSFVLAAPGRAFTWGRNVHGQLGHPPTAASATTRKGEAHVLEPRHLRALDGRGRLAEVACGEYMTAALTQQGDVLTWGRATNGRGGTGRPVHPVPEPCALPRRAFGGAAVTTLALGWRHCLARTREGLLFSWGAGGHGQLGLESCRDAHTPQHVEALAREAVVVLGAGAMHSLAVTREGVVFAWGEGSAGQLGLGACSATARPQGVAALLDQPSIVALDAGAAHSAFVTSTGELLTCGDDSYGQLGWTAPPGAAAMPAADAPVAAAAAATTTASTAAAAPPSDPLSSGTRGFPDVPSGLPATSAPAAASASASAALPNPRGVPRKAKLPEALFVREVACGAHHTVVLATNSVNVVI